MRSSAAGTTELLSLALTLNFPSCHVFLSALLSYSLFKGLGEFMYLTTPTSEICTICSAFISNKTAKFLSHTCHAWTFLIHPQVCSEPAWHAYEAVFTGCKNAVKDNLAPRVFLQAQPDISNRIRLIVEATA